MSGKQASAHPFWIGAPEEQQVKYTMVPAGGGQLPAGVSIEEDSGKITISTIATSAVSGTYTVTATGAGEYTGLKTANVNITVNNALMQLAGVLSYVPLVTFTGSADVTANPIWTGVPEEQKVKYTMVPAGGGQLPAGVSIEEDSGKITISTIATSAVSGTYTVTATGTDQYTGDIKAAVEITVNDQGIPVIGTFSYAAIETVAGTAVSGDPQWVGATSEQKVTYTIVLDTGGDLPIGIGIEEDSGKIKVSSDAEAQASGSYTVTASGTGAYIGIQSASVTITIIARITGTLRYSGIITEVGQEAHSSPIWEDAPSGQTVRYAMTQEGGGQLPASVSIEDGSGVITVASDAALSESGNYEVVATGIDDYAGEITILVRVVIVLPYFLSDSGSIISGHYPRDVNNDCNARTAISGDQDCNVGRDADSSLTKIGGGAAGFDYSKLDASGTPLAIQDKAWSDTGSEAEGTQWSCVKDNVTGFVWEVKTKEGDSNSSRTYTWQDSIDVLASSLNANSLCGISDWRIPTIVELTSIVHYGRAESIDTDFFPNGLDESDKYWTSNSFASYNENSWGISFFGGYFKSYSKQDFGLARAVSGPSVSWETEWDDTRYVDNNDGTVTDYRTQLVWKKCSEGQNYNAGTCEGTANKYTWREALESADSSDFAGVSDWRAPNIKELQSLVMYNTYDPAINSNVFPKTQSARYWTSTPNLAINLNSSWAINFLNGSSELFGLRTEQYYLRLVRAGR